MNISKARLSLSANERKRDRREGHDKEIRSTPTSQESHLSLTQAKNNKRLTASSPSFVCVSSDLFKPFGSARGIFILLPDSWQHSVLTRVKCPLFCSEFPKKSSHQYGHTAAASRVCRNSLELWWLKYYVVYLFRSG